MLQISARLRSLSAILLVVLVFPGCSAIDAICGSARPAPKIATISPTTAPFAQVQLGLVLTVNGSQFVSASVVVVNGTSLPTTITSSQQLQATVTTAVVPAAGSASVTVNTPGGTSGDAGCSSGGTSSALTLTIT